MFVVLNTTTGSADAIAVFSSKEKAQAFIETSAMDDAVVEEHEVTGDYAYPSPIYVAHTYRGDSGHEFAGLFSNQASAMAVVGLRGLAVRLMPDAV